MNENSNALSRSLLVLAVLLCIFLFLRSAWVGIEGLAGTVKLDQRDWKIIIACLLGCGGFAFVTLRKMLSAKFKSQ